MIQVSRSDFDKLREANLIRFGHNKNYRISNKTKCGKHKKYYVVEERAILSYLNRNSKR